LGYDALDLVDRILEWREAGPSPVDPAVLLDRLLAADPKNAFWAGAVSDSELREALRADGRNPRKTERHTVHAAGNKLRMRMGLPPGEGDGYVQAPVAAARRAVALRDSPENRRALTQPLTILAERALQSGRLDRAREALAEAAPLLDLEAPPPSADEA